MTRSFASYRGMTYGPDKGSGVELQKWECQMAFAVHMPWGHRVCWAWGGVGVVARRMGEFSPVGRLFGVIFSGLCFWGG